MNLLSRIFRRTPSLRTRVVVATAIGAAIPVLIVGTVVWVGITNDRKERLDRRLDEAAGFAIPFLPRGLDEIPKIAQRPRRRHHGPRGRRRSRPTPTSCCPSCLPATQTPSSTVSGIAYAPWRFRAPGADVGRRRRHLRRDHRRHQQPASAGDHHLSASPSVPPPCSGGCWPHSRCDRSNSWPSRPGQIDAGDEAPDIEVRGASEAVEIAEAMKGMLHASGTSRTAPRRRSPRRATSPRCRPTNCARR